MPDAIPYAARLALAMVLAYAVSFTIQLDSASSAGVCVGIVMQPSLGMTMSKAAYRIAGTLAGGIASLIIVGLFPQDRTTLLMAVALWLGACTYVASLLRDFRAYGAVLAGYTVSVIAVGQIDAPGNALLATLDRVAAILVGIACVAVVNSLFRAASAHEHLVAELGRHERDLRESAVDTLRGGAGPQRIPHIERAAAILGLQTEASYASAELADGLRRNHAATAALSALIGMVAASRELRRALGGPGTPAPATIAYLRTVADAVAASAPPPPLPTGRLSRPVDALLIERAAGLAAEAERARRAIHATHTGETAGLPQRNRLRSDPDRVAAILNALRTMAATGLGALLCILGNDASTTLLLIQISAFTALLGLQPNPSAAAATFLPPLPVGVLITGVVAFVLLPQASGFGAFTLAVGAATFLLGLVTRHPRTARFAPALLIYFTILLAPSDVQSFDPTAFANTALQLLLSAFVTVAAFRLVLPVDPRRRLLRVGDKIVHSLRQALLHGTTLGERGDRAIAFDRLAQALVWTRARHPNRPSGIQPVLARLCAFAELDAAACRAWEGLHALAAMPGLASTAQESLAHLASADPDALDRSAQELLGHCGAGDGPHAALLAVSGMHGAALLLRREAVALSRYGVTEA